MMTRCFMDLTQVTLTQMRYAVAVSDSKSFRRAAELSHVSQPGLSMQIQKLEDLLGVVLFDRGKKPVLTTERGQNALEQMRAVLRETERLGQLVAEEDEPQGRYRLGVIPSLSSTVLPLILGSFIRRYPLVDLWVEEMKTADIIEALAADTLDAGLAATPLHVPGLHEDVVGREMMFAYLSPGDALLRKKKVSQKELSSQALWVMPEGHCFRSQVLSYCSADSSGIKAPVHFESGSFQTLIRLVDDGLGATVLPALVAAALPTDRKREQLRPLSAPQPLREIGVVRSRRFLREKVSSALVDLTREKLGEELAQAGRNAVVLDPLKRPDRH